MRNWITPAWLVLGLLAGPAAGAALEHTARPITFGVDAKGEEGDQNYSQVILFTLPETTPGPLYLRLFDPEVGGQHDELHQEANTGTRFRFYGGDLDLEGLRRPVPTQEAIQSGDLLAERQYLSDPLLDGQWVTLASFRPEQGKATPEGRLFKLVVEGLEGNDGNAFEAGISRGDKANLPPEGLRLFSYAPTVHVPKLPNRLLEARFLVPRNAKALSVRNFDLDGFPLSLELPEGSKGALRSSASGEWAEQRVEFAPGETGDYASLVMPTRAEANNDVLFHLVDEQGVLLPFELPMRLHPKNARPEPRVVTTILGDCREVVFDATGSIDPDGDNLLFRWFFGDGEQGEGNPIRHAFPAAGRYQARLLVQDASGTVGSRSLLELPITLNLAPEPVIAAPAVAAPGTEVDFDGSGSKDSDGKILDYLWDFGDGSRASGARVQHRFNYPGNYRILLQVRDDSKSPCELASAQQRLTVNAAPVVDAGPNRIGAVGEALLLTPREVYDSDGEVTDYQWDFGDGATAWGREVRHAFERPGVYRVTLRIRDDSGVANDIAEDSLRVVINDPPQPQGRGPGRIVAVGEELAPRARRLASALRAGGASVVVPLRPQAVRKQFQAASSEGARRGPGRPTSCVPACSSRRSTRSCSPAGARGCATSTPTSRTNWASRGGNSTVSGRSNRCDGAR